MNNLRMPKGWTLVGTNDMAYGDTETREDKFKRDHKFDSLIRNIPKESHKLVQEIPVK